MIPRLKLSLTAKLSMTFLVIADIYTKYLAFVHLKDNVDRSIIEGFLGLSYHTNSGMAFGLFQGGRWIFVILTTIVLYFLYQVYKTLGDDKISKTIKACLVLISSGAIGNGINRLMDGYVIDFIKKEFMNFPLFNFADIYVVVGTIVLLIVMIFFFDEEIFENRDKNE